MFWSQTPRLFHLALKGRLESQKTRNREQAALAWMTAALSRADRLPDYEKFVGLEKTVRPQSASEIKSILKAMFKGHSFPSDPPAQ